MFTSNLELHRLEVSVIENVLFPVMSRFSLSRGASMDVARSNLGDRIKRCGRSPVPFRLYDEMKNSRLVQPSSAPGDARVCHGGHERGSRSLRRASTSLRGCFLENGGIQSSHT